MKEITFIFSLLAASFIVSPAGALERDINVQYNLNLASQGSMQKAQLGTQLIYGTVRTLKCQWSFARQGGAVGSINLQTIDGEVCRLPAKAIVVKGFVDALTTPTGGSSTTIAIGTGASTTDLKAATAIASYTGQVSLTPDWTVGNMVKVSTEVIPEITIANPTMATGKLNVFIQYLLSD